MDDDKMIDEFHHSTTMDIGMDHHPPPKLPPKHPAKFTCF